MYVNEKMKLNKFVQVKIPKNKEYFRRFNGNLPIPSDGNFSGDEVVPAGMTKNQQLHYGQCVVDNAIANHQEEEEEVDTE